MAYDSRLPPLGACGLPSKWFYFEVKMVESLTNWIYNFLKEIMTVGEDMVRSRKWSHKMVVLSLHFADLPSQLRQRYRREFQVP